MQDFIAMAVSKLGTSEADTKSATQGVLGLLKQHASGSDFSQLLAKVPGAGDMLGKSGGHGIAGLAGTIGGMLGGQGKEAAAATGLAGILGSLGGKSGGFVQLLGGYLKQKAGSDLVGRIFAKVPDLAKLLG